MSRRVKPLPSRRRRNLSFQTLEVRRLLAVTAPDAIELTSKLGPFVYSGVFEQRSTIAPQYVVDSQGNRAIDLRVNLPGDQTVHFPSIGISDDSPLANEQAGRVVRMLLNPNERYAVTAVGSSQSETWSYPVTALNAAGEVIERLAVPVEFDPNIKSFGLSRGYIGDINWISTPSLRLPPETVSIIVAQGAILSIGFVADEFEGASKAVRWNDEPMLVSSKNVDFVEADDPIAVDPSKLYTLDVRAETTDTSNPLHSIGYTAYDRDGNLIEPQHVMRYLNAMDTTLKQELRPGDTFIELADASGWSNLSSDPATRSLAWFGYQDSIGNTYANYTYTRNVAIDPAMGLWSAGAVVGNRITLSKPWSGPTLPSGLAVRNAVAGSSLFAVLANDQMAPLRQTVNVTGTWRAGSQSASAFPPGAAAIYPAAELNQALAINGKTKLTYKVGINQAPTSTATAAREVTIDVLANDSAAGADARITQVTAPKFGSVEIVSTASGRPAIKYTALPYFVGVDRFLYTFSSGGVSLTEQVSVSSLGSNLESDPALSQRIAAYPGITTPNIIAHFQPMNSYEVVSGSELVVNDDLGPRIAEDLGEGSMPVFVSLLAAPTHGSITLEPSGAFRYIADPNYSGNVQFIANISNGVQSLDLPVTIAVRGTAAEVDQNKLAKIGRAEESHYGTYQQYFYPNLTTQPQLSWRVYALPFLGYSKLFAKFRLDEPWDSANNLPLAAEMPDVYRSWGDADNSFTRFQTIQGSASSPTKHWLNVSAIPRARRGNATHGDGNAILVLQTAPFAAAVWTKPDDLVYTDAQSTLAKLTTPLFPAYFWGSSQSVASSVKLVPQSISTDQFQSIATIAQSPGVVGVDVDSLARAWAERPDTPATREEFGVPKAPTNIRRISIALGNFESTFKVLPQATRSPNLSEPTPVSWRVQLLPYLGLSELYDRYKFNEPWDSPANLALLNEMPDVYRSANDASTSTTTRIRFLDGTDTAHDRSRSRLNMSNFRDGLGNTLLFAEVGIDKGVPWTQPEAIPVDMSSIWASLGSFPDGYVRIGLASGYSGMLGTRSPNAEVAALLTMGLAKTTVRPRAELYDGLTIIERSGMSVNLSARDSLGAISFAALNFENAFKRLPSNTFATGTTSSPLLSWRVAILPYLESTALYSEFHFDEPWDSPNNLSLLEYMPYWFRSYGDSTSSTVTRMQSFVGDNSLINTNGKRVRSFALPNGLSNTLAFVQTGVDKSVAWTKPNDVNGDSSNIWKELGRVGKTAAFALTDTGVRSLGTEGLGQLNLNEATSALTLLNKTIIAANTLVIREGDFAKVEVFHLAFDEVFEMDQQSFLTMVPGMTFAAAENSTLDGTRKVQLRWGKRSDPTNPNSPLIVSQTLDVYVTDNETNTLGVDTDRVNENGGVFNFVATRGTTSDLNTPLTIALSTDAPNRIQLPSSVIIPAGETFVRFVGVATNNADVEGPVSIQVTASATGRLDSTVQLTIADDDALRLSIDPTTINETKGTATGTVTRLFGSLDAPLTVFLKSSDTNVARVAFQATIPAGRSSANFTITAMNDAKTDGVQLVNITADAKEYGRSEQSLTINDFGPLDLRADSISVSEHDGKTLITLSRGEAGLSSPLTVQLRSSDATELLVPPTVTIPANERSITFEAISVNDALLDGPQVVTIFASNDLFDSGFAVVTVNDYEELSIQFDSNSMTENGGSVQALLTRGNRDDLSQAVTVQMHTNTPGAIELPATVTIPAGLMSVSFSIKAIDDSILNANRVVYVEAVHPAYVNLGAELMLEDHETLTIDFVEARIAENGQTQGRVTRSNTNNNEAITVALKQNATGLIIPALVTIPVGSAFGYFTIVGDDNLVLESTRTVEIEASHSLYFSAPSAIEVTDFEPLQFELSELRPYEGTTILATVTRNVDDLSHEAIVSVAVSDASLLTAPSSVTLPPNVRTISFQIDVPRDRLRDGDKLATIGLSSQGFVGASLQLTTLDLESLWHNPRSSLDVNDDGTVSPLDALLVINLISVARGPVGDMQRNVTSPLFADTNNDGQLSPIDALLVINELSGRSNGGNAEGESSLPNNMSVVTDTAISQLADCMDDQTDVERRLKRRESANTRR